MLRKNKSSTSQLIQNDKKIRNSFKSITATFVGKLKSIRTFMFLIIAVIGIVPIISLNYMIHYYYREAIIKEKTAALQTKSVELAAEFSKYDSLIEAGNHGVYDLLVDYSAFEETRFRVIDLNFIVYEDTYSFETGKKIISPRIIDTFTSKKTSSEYERNTGTIEVDVPIFNNKNVIIGIFTGGIDVSEIDEIQSEVVIRTDIICLALIMIFLGMDFLLTSTAARNTQKDWKQVEQIADGHKGIKLKEKGFSEFVFMARHFNSIMEKAEALDETRQEFVSNVSHELKTPITSIKVLADSLNIQEDVPVELYKEFMVDIANEIDRESKIIEDLLSLVRLDKNTEVLNISPVNLNDLMELILRRLKPIAQKKNIELLLESFRPVVAQVDEVKFTQVISNLVENAIKYNNEDGWVHVSLNADYQYCYIRVEDSGIGIPKDEQELVFERFYRVDKARSRETGGTGLGLAIVKNIILMHHGTIKMYSEEGNGTTFTIRIPLNYN